MYMFIVQIFCEFCELCNVLPWYWNTLFYSLVSSEENSLFTQLVATIASHNNLAFLVQLVPTLLGRQRYYGMRSLPDTSPHDQQWESNPRPFDLESNTLCTWPHAVLYESNYTINHKNDFESTKIMQIYTH